MRESFILYTKFYTAIRTLSDEQLGRLFRAIFEYETDGTENTQPDIGMAFTFIKNQLDVDAEKYLTACEKKAQAVKKRWDEYKDLKQKQAFIDMNRYLYTSNKTIDIQQHNRCLSDSDSDSENENENENENEGETESENENDLNNTLPASPGYGTYGNVILSDAEISALRRKYPKDFNKKIDKLSLYMHGTGKNYRNHMAMILKWAAEDEAKRGTGKPAKGYTFTNIDNHSYTEQDYNAMFDNFGMEERGNI